MSLDLSLGKPKCKTCGHHEPDFTINYTYNAAPMWARIYPDCSGMVDIEGLTGQTAYKILVHAREYMEANRGEMIKLEPANKWGSYEGFLNFINECIQASLANPESIWEADR